MKRLLILLVSLLVAIPLALGGIAGVAYFTTSEETIPKPIVTVMDTEVPLAGYTWREPVFGGLIYRDFEKPVEDRPLNLGELNQTVLPVQVPNGYTSRATVYSGEERLWSGHAGSMDGFKFLNNGPYRLEIVCQRGENSGRGQGELYYQVTFNLKVEPRLEHSEDWVTQGDVMAIRVFNLANDMTATGSSDLGPILFTPSGDGMMTALVPVGHDCPEGTYSVTVNVKSFHWEIPVRVTNTHFGLESIMYPDPATGIVLPPEEQPDVNPSLTSDFFKTLAPLLDESDPVQYWEGLFTQPTKGTLAAEYGTERYTNQDAQSTSWAGIDIDAERGTDVVAPNAGRVVYADTLRATGNTIVIDHGGGLKSLLFYMDELLVAEGDMVAKGEVIGTVGSTGYATQPKLHYEVRLFHATVNPGLLFRGTSKMFFFDR